jgi:hypothetical protein
MRVAAAVQDMLGQQEAQGVQVAAVLEQQQLHRQELLELLTREVAVVVVAHLHLMVEQGVQEW